MLRACLLNSIAATCPAEWHGSARQSGRDRARKVNVGKWASARHGGRVAQYGSLQQMQDGDMGLSSETATSFTFELLVPIPAGADKWCPAVVDTVTNLMTQGTPSALSDIAITGLTNLRPYRIYGAWFSGSLQVSEWKYLDTLAPE